MNIIEVSWEDVWKLIKDFKKTHGEIPVYGVPKNGLIIASEMGLRVNTPEEADIIIDDIVDSGNTKKYYTEKYPNKPFVTLFKKKVGCWYHFPWEKNSHEDIQETVVRQLEYLGEDVTREGLLDTPKRVIKSWKKLYGGYSEDPLKILSTTFNQKYDQIVLLKDIEMYSTCEHHMLPFFGKCHIAYIPDRKVVGISKLARVMECFARRLQIQERLCNQIVDSLQECLSPKGCACIIEAQHFCMTSRGVEKQKSIMVTSALRGVFEKEVNARQELMGLIK